MPRCVSASSAAPPPAGLVLLLTLNLLGAACAPDLRMVAVPSTPDRWEPWQVLEANTGRVVPYNEWLIALTGNDIVYLGEEHHNQHHIDAARRLLDAFLAAGLLPTIGMEMFGWDGQPALNAYLQDRTLDRGTFLEEVRWKQNWGGPFDDYEPLVAYAGAHRLALRAMNPPKSLIRQVAKEGLAQARQGSEWTQWDMQREEIVDDPAYRNRILDQLRRCHGNGTIDDVRTMYEASMVRDEGMAKTLTDILHTFRRDPESPRQMIVSYTGGGHIQYGLPVPKRVARRLDGHIRYTTVYLTSYDQTRKEEIRELLRDGVADYIWLTPLGRHGVPVRCR